MAAHRRASAAPRLVRVFLCDDTRDLRERVRAGLTAHDDLIVVGEADDPVEGLPLIADLQPDVVVCDLSMPRMDGLAAIPRIAELAPNAGIVIFSGYLSDALGASALALGADRYVQKDATAVELAAAVREVAASRRAGLRPQPPQPGATTTTAAAAPRPGAREERALEELVVEAGEIPDRVIVGSALAALALAAAGSLIAGIVPVALLVLYLAPVLVVSGLRTLRLGLLLAIASGGLYALCALCATQTVIRQPLVGSGGVLAAALVLALGAHRLVAWMNRRMVLHAALTQELQRSNSELEHFAYVASHDLAAPLRSIASSPPCSAAATRVGSTPRPTR